VHVFACQPLFVRIIQRLRDWFDLAMDKLLRYITYCISVSVLNCLDSHCTFIILLSEEVQIIAISMSVSVCICQIILV